MALPFDRNHPHGKKEPMLMDISTAKPGGEVNWEAIVAKTQRDKVDQTKKVYDTTKYLAQTREEDPWPEEAQATASVTLSLSNCRFLDPAPLDLAKPVRVACDVSGSADLPESDRFVEFRFRIIHRKNSLDTEESLHEVARADLTAAAKQSPELAAKISLPAGLDDLENGAELFLIAEAYRSDRKLTSTANPIPVVGGPTVVRRVRLSGNLFDFDNCFILPDALAGIRQAALFHAKRPTDSIVIVGHVAQDQKTSTGLDRAKTVAAILTNKWEDLVGYFKADGSGKWGTREAQLILEHLGIYKGEAAGIIDSATTQAITQFQKSVNEKGKTHLEESGKLDASTCQALLWAYCQDGEATLAKCATPKVAGSRANPDSAAMPDGSKAPDERLEILFFQRRLDPEPSGEQLGANDKAYSAWMACLKETEDFEVHSYSLQLADKQQRALPNTPVKLSGPLQKSGQSDSHGRIQFKGLARGSYKLEILTDPKRPSTLTFEVPNAAKVNKPVQPAKPSQGESA
ncbi:MAG TPA: peptidoglycan-binding domain-containing protein [Fibrobacteria bacterium]|nr:peptidoglycan-binding domain-containing protein [Fibrobacteria bacterium]